MALMPATNECRASRRRLPRTPGGGIRRRCGGAAPRPLPWSATGPAPAGLPAPATAGSADKLLGSAGDESVRQQLLDDLRWLGTVEEESLRGIAAGRLEVAELVGGLDALGGDRQLERVAELDHRVDDRHVLLVVGQAAYERPVNLDAVDGEPAQVLERRVAGAEVVDRDLDPELLDLGEHADRRLGILDQHALGDLEAEPGGIDAGLLDDPPKPSPGTSPGRAAGPRR